MSPTRASRGESKPPARRKSPASAAAPKRWSQHGTETSHALDLEPEVFKSSDPKEIAQSLKRSAEASTQRKGTPYQSAMSMLNFYVNRAGRTLPDGQRRVLEDAKAELRKAFGRA